MYSFYRQEKPETNTNSNAIHDSGHDDGDDGDDGDVDDDDDDGDKDEGNSSEDVYSDILTTEGQPGWMEKLLKEVREHL